MFSLTIRLFDDFYVFPIRTVKVAGYLEILAENVHKSLVKHRFSEFIGNQKIKLRGLEFQDSGKEKRSKSR